jgi:hypothetical protein
VRHGKVAADGKSFEFLNRCGLRMKQDKQVDCEHQPPPERFNYQSCAIYMDVFKTAGDLNDVMPTSDIQFSENLGGSSVSDMDMV